MNNSDLSNIKRLIRIIESQLEWGEGANWANKDFETLSEQIFTKTGKQLSTSTLKRIWGRVKRTAQPSVTSLDILSEFAGFENWRACRQQMLFSEETEVKNKLTYANWLIGGVVVILIILITSIVVYQPKKKVTINSKVPHSDSVQFDFKKVTTGYPNTVIFEYDIGNAPFQTLQIQQSWDESRRITLEKPKGLVTTTYYDPGYFLTKLVVNNQIVKQKDLYIPTKGWQAYMGGNIPEIIYIKEHKILKDSILHLEKSVLDEMNQYHPVHIWVSNLSPKPQINSVDFSLESAFRMLQPTEKSVCQEVWMVIVGSKEVFRFEFSIPGCVGDLRFYLKGDRISGKNQNLSAFGLDFSKWNNFKVIHKNKQLKAFINNKLIFTHRLSSDIGLIGGVKMMFEGLGEVQKLIISDNQHTIDLIKK